MLLGKIYILVIRPQFAKQSATHTQNYYRQNTIVTNSHLHESLKTNTDICTLSSLTQKTNMYSYTPNSQTLVPLNNFKLVCIDMAS